MISSCEEETGLQRGETTEGAFEVLFVGRGEAHLFHALLGRPALLLQRSGPRGLGRRNKGGAERICHRLPGAPAGGMWGREAALEPSAGAAAGPMLCRLFPRPGALLLLPGHFTVQQLPAALASDTCTPSE